MGEASDLAAKMAFGRTEDLTTNDLPFVDKLAYTTGEWLDRDRYYRFRDEVRSAKEAYQAARENREQPSDEVKKMAQLEGYLKAVDKQVTRLRVSMSAIDQRPGLSDDKRYLLKNKLRERQNMYMLRFNKAFVQRMGAQGE